MQLAPSRPSRNKRTPSKQPEAGVIRQSFLLMKKTDKEQSCFDAFTRHKQPFFFARHKYLNK